MSLRARSATAFFFAASALLPSLRALATIKLGQVAPDFKLEELQKAAAPANATAPAAPA